MNKERRAKIDLIIEKLGQIQGEIKEIEEENDVWFNLSVNLQMPKKGEEMLYKVSQLSCAADFVDNILYFLQEAQE